MTPLALLYAVSHSLKGLPEGLSGSVNPVQLKGNHAGERLTTVVCICLF